MVKKQKQCTNADLQPNRTYTRQHLYNSTLTRLAPPTDIYTKTPKEKEVATSLNDFPERPVLLSRPRLRTPPDVVHGARAARSSRRPLDSSDGVLGELDRVLPAISVRTGWGMAGAPSRDCSDWLEKPRAQPNHGQNGRCTHRTILAPTVSSLS